MPRVTLVLCALLVPASLLPVPVSAAPLGSVLGSIAAPGPCTTGLTWDGRSLWAADHRSDTLYELDPKTGAVRRKLPSPGPRPAGLAWDGRRLWSLDPYDRTIYRVDPAKAVTDHRVESPVGEAVALGWDGKHLWIADSRTAKLHRLDPDDGTTIDSRPIPGRSADGLAFDGRYLWLADRLADRIYALDAATGEVLLSVPAPGPHVTGLAFDGKSLWAADYQTDRIYRLEHRGDGKPWRKAGKREQVEYTHELSNHGPGTVTEAHVYVAVPGDEAAQRLLAPVRFTPTPTEVVSDQWGQKIAHFAFKDLAPGARATVRMVARAQLFEVRNPVLPHQVKGALTDEARRFLGDESKYLIKDPVIQRAVKQAVGGEKNPYWVARKIYRHVHGKMVYKLAGGWNVAPRVLERGNGSCSEYSFVFIAMCRAAGVPARFAGALVLRKDDSSYDDVFHRWVEIFLPGYGWLPVDPSRGDKPGEAERAEAFGNLEPTFLITTRGGGASRYLGWQYNAEERWTCRGQCRVKVERIAEWEPFERLAEWAPRSE
jgi:transglutaminase-like putative cysteine protease